LSAANFDLIGPALPIAQDVYVVGAGSGQSAAVQFSVSPTGALVYQTGTTQQQQLVWFDRSGKTLGNLGPRGTTNQPEISPDGKRVMADGTKDIWMYDTTRGNASRFTLAEAGDNAGVWAPDGSRVVFGSTRNRRSDLYLKPADGGPEQVLLTTDQDNTPDDWSRDGRRIIIDVYSGHNTKLDLWWLPLDGDRKPVPYLQTPFNEAHGRLSPDGKWLAYASDETGRSEIYVQSFPTPGGRVLISTSGGDQPGWRRDGKELYYLSLDRKLMSVEVTGGATFESGTPKVLFQTRAPAVGLLAFRNHYAVAPNGQKFLVATVPEDMSTAPLVMVLNWVPRIGKP
jgi:Tol biopolymer transport system component